MDDSEARNSEFSRIFDYGLLDDSKRAIAIQIKHLVLDSLHFKATMHQEYVFAAFSLKSNVGCVAALCSG